MKSLFDEEELTLCDRTWPHQIRKVVCLRDPSWPAVVCGDIVLSYSCFISLSIRIRDIMCSPPMSLNKASRVMVYYNDTPLSRVTFICTVTGLAMIGASFTVLDERMPNRAQLHVAGIYKPQLVLDLSNYDQDDEEIYRLKLLQTPIFKVQISQGLMLQHSRTSRVYSFFDSNFEIDEKIRIFDEMDWTTVTNNINISFLPISAAVEDCNSKDAGRFWCESNIDDVAFVDWTSGSSNGLPKGCSCLHSTLSRMLYSKYFSVNKLFSYDNLQIVGVNLFMLWYWWQPICAGHTTALLLSSEVTDIPELYSALTRMKVTALDCITPSLLQTMLSCYTSASKHRLPLTMIVGGEMLTLSCAKQFYEISSNQDSHQGYRLINLFSTTETGDCSYYHVTKDAIRCLQEEKFTYCPIGRPIDGISFSIDTNGEKGLIVGGVYADHYLSNESATAKYFDTRGWLSHDQSHFIDVSGEIVVMLSGRSDDCVKVRGFKVDLNAVEEALSKCSDIQSVCAVYNVASDSLVAFIVLKQNGVPLSNRSLYQYVEGLPNSHTPQTIKYVDTIPLTRTGKADRQMLMKLCTEPQEVSSNDATTKSSFQCENDIEQKVRHAWSAVMNWSGNLEKSFWDIGGHSLLAMQLCAKLDIPSSLLFGGEVTTAADMISYLLRLSNNKNDAASSPCSSIKTKEHVHEPIAIVGMSGRWPGIGQTKCSDIFDAFKEGDFEPLSSPPSSLNLGNVKHGFYLKEELIKEFDHKFWNMTIDEAMYCDPQHRSFLEMSLEAFFDAGIPVTPGNASPLNCGVFASSGSLSHYLDELKGGQSLSEIRTTDPSRYFNLEVGNDKDYIASRLAYSLNLIGPAICIQSACSSGLVALCQAVESIRNGHCNMAVAGGVSIHVPQTEHAYMQDMIWSPDGRCKPFDADAMGTANCNGGHVFILKPLSLAIKDGDSVYACIRGVAASNDGRVGKRNFSSPSSIGYARVASQALSDAGVDGAMVRMLEAHGTGTKVGDPIEMEGIVQAYGSPSTLPLSVGSLKGNIGHANTAAGLLSLAKSVMCVYNDILVPSGNFRSSSDVVAVEARKSKRTIIIQKDKEMFGSYPRLASVSSMGIGGTTAHVIIEEYPDTASAEPLNTSDLFLPVSASSQKSLEAYLRKLTSHITRNPNIHLKPLCATLGSRRPQLKYRKCIFLPRDQSKLRDALHDAVNEYSVSSLPANKRGKYVVLVFGGQGAELPKDFDLTPPEVIEVLGYDPLHKFWSDGGSDPVLYQLATFSVQLGIGLRVVSTLNHDGKYVGVGHSLGEWVAAVLSGLLSISVAIQCLVSRAKILAEHMVGSSMVSVCACVEDVQREIDTLQIELEVACVNSQDRVVLAGATACCEEYCKASRFICKKIHSSGAFHSRFVDKGMPELEQSFKQILPTSASLISDWTVVSCIDAKHLDEKSSNYLYWSHQARSCVNFSSAVSNIDEMVGEGAVWVLSGVSRSLCKKKERLVCIDGYCKTSVNCALMKAWEMGVDIKMEAIVGRCKPILSLPSYQWDRSLCWPETQKEAHRSSDSSNQKLLPSTSLSSPLYSERWMPVYEGYEKRDKGPYVSFCIEEHKGESLSAPFVTAVQNCCEALQTCGRLVLFSQFSSQCTSEISHDTPTRQCFLLSRFLYLVQAILSSVECLDAIQSPLPHDSYSQAGGIVLIVSEMENCLVESGAVLGAARCIANEHPEILLNIFRIGSDKEYPLSLKSDISFDLFFSALNVPIGEYRLTTTNRIEVRTICQSSVYKQSPGVKPQGGVSVISGGLGGLGLVVAEWLLSVCKVDTVVLLTRRKTFSLPEKLTIFKDRISIMQADVCDLKSLQRLNLSWHLVTCVVHCAGSVFDSLVRNAPTKQSELQDHLFAKTVGISNMLSLVSTSAQLICFSSASGCLGSLGQVTYCAANCAMDMIVEKEFHNSGRSSLSIQWGGWSKEIPGSMSDRYNVLPSGDFESFFTAENGIMAMERALQCANTITSVLAIDVSDWELYSSKMGICRSLLSPLFDNVLDTTFRMGTRLQIPHEEQLPWLPQWNWLADHKYNGKSLFPATASLELLAQRRSNVALIQVKFESMIQSEAIITLKNNVISSQNGVCVRALDAIESRNNLPKVVINVCINDAALAISESEGSKDAFTASWIASSVIYEKHYNGKFFYGPSFARLGDVYFDRKWNLALGYVRGRNESQEVHENEYFFPLAPELDACCQICTVLGDEHMGSSIPLSVGTFAIQSMDFTKLEQFQVLETFFAEKRLSKNDWLVIGRKHSDEIEGEFDIICFKPRDLMVVSFEKLVLQPIADGTKTESCISAKLLHSESTSNALEFKSIQLEEMEFLSRNHDVDEDFEVVLDEDFRPAFRPIPPSQKLPSQCVLVRVTAYALNFLDVLSCTGVMPSNYFGGECVGIVERLGDEVTHLQVGDRVAVLLLGQGMRSKICVPSHLVSPPLPSCISDNEAVTIPVAYATAWLALEWMGRVKNDEVALVHSAAGGVGLACVALLRHRNCRVIGTCSPGKAKALEAFGVRSSDIFHSRVPSDWVSGCHQALGGRNCLSICVGAFAGDNLKLSIQLMAPMGQILDFAKRDQMEQNVLQMSPFLKGLTYSAAHLDALMNNHPDLTGTLLQQVWASLGEKVRPLPHEVYNVEDVQSAMKRLASGSLVGKIVVKFRDMAEPAWEIVRPPKWLANLKSFCHLASGVDNFEAYLRKYGGGLLQGDSNPRNIPVVEVMEAPEGVLFPVANTIHDDASRVVLLSSSIMRHLNSHLDTCAALCHCAAQGDPGLYACTEESNFFATNCVPREWRAISRDLRSSSSAKLSEGDVYQWLLNEVLTSSGLSEEEVMKHSLEELGFDSLSCLQLSHKLHVRFPSRTKIQITGNAFISDLLGSSIESDSAVLKMPRPKRWLALHGFRMNKDIFQFQMENMIKEMEKLQQEEDCISRSNIKFLNAPIPSQGPSEEGMADLCSMLSNAESSDDIHFFEWWNSGVIGECFESGWIGKDGLDLSFEYLLKFVANHEIDGVIGMSQGAGMAYLLLLAGAVQRGILFSPVGPSEFQQETRKIVEARGRNTSPNSTQKPSLVAIWDPRDDPSDEFVSEVILSGPLPGAQIHHDGGHTVPQDVHEGGKRRYIVEKVAEWLSNNT